MHKSGDFRDKTPQLFIDRRRQQGPVDRNLFNATRGLRAARQLAMPQRVASLLRGWPMAKSAHTTFRIGGFAEPNASPETPSEMSTRRLSRVEALLLVASEPLTSRRLAKLANLSDATEARTLVDRLAKRLRQRGSGLVIEQVAGGYRLVTRPSLASWVRKMHGLLTDLAMTPAMMETLAVVAYRQPVLRAEIEAIRGVQCGDLLRQLIQRDFLRIVGRSSELGRPLQYGTTKRFLEAFGLRDLAQLPPLDESNEAESDATIQRLAA